MIDKNVLYNKFNYLFGLNTIKKWLAINPTFFDAFNSKIIKKIK